MNDILRESIYQSLLSLATEEGINASGKEDVYGCIFGRDSAVTILKILRVLKKQSAKSYYDTYRLTQICRTALLTLTSLQGTEFNKESGEEPGKFIHEYRKEKYERLLTLEKPWYVYPDGILRNYDSIDATPLALIAMYRYWELTHDSEFLLSVLPHVEKGLNWIISFGDRDKDGLLEYELSSDRIHGGLPVQSWTDSHESLLQKDGKMPIYPIAPVEVQGYAWLALKLWANFYADETNIFAHTLPFAQKLKRQASKLKKQFNTLFLFEDTHSLFLAQALDGYKNRIPTVTGNPLLVLWASYEKNGKIFSILEKQYVPQIVKRAFATDMFESDAGIRTMSSLSPTYNPNTNSYHNGSFWPKLNGMIHEGLHVWGFEKEAEQLRHATLTPIQHFGTPIELYIKTREGLYEAYMNDRGQTSCKTQAWSAAVALDLLTD